MRTGLSAMLALVLPAVFGQAQDWEAIPVVKEFGNQTRHA